MNCWVTKLLIGQVLFIKVLQLIKKEGTIELEFNFITLNEVMDLGNDNQWLLTLQKDTSKHYVPPDGSVPHTT